MRSPIVVIALLTSLAAGAGVAVAGCKSPVLPAVQNVVNVVLTDLQAGDSDAQIASDVCKALGGSAPTDAVCGGVEVVIQDAIALLIDSGTLSAADLSKAQAYQTRHSKLQTPAPASK